MPAQSSRRRKSAQPKKRKTRWLQEIRKQRKSTNLLIRKLPFARVVREIASSLTGENLRWQSAAILALQEATEAFFVQFFEDCTILCSHGNRCTVMIKDFRTLVALKYPNMNPNLAYQDS